MKSNFFTHKFLPILSILILVSFVFINNCFANNGLIINHNNQDVFLPALPSSNYDSSSDLFFICYVKGWAGYENETYRYTIFKNLKSYIDDGYAVHMDSNGGNYFKMTLEKSGSPTIDISGSVTYYCYEYDDTSDVWELVTRTKYDIGVPMCWNQYSDIFYSNFDIYSNRSENAGLFFQQTPLTLAGVLRMNNPVEIFQSLMKKLVISLLLFVICYLGLRKAWKFLRTQLKGC